MTVRIAMKYASWEHGVLSNAFDWFYCLNLPCLMSANQIKASYCKEWESA